MIEIVVYISELRPDLLDDLCSKHFLIVDKVQQNELKKLIIGSAANFSYASHFVIDLSSLADNNDDVLDAVTALKTMYSSKCIVVVADKEPENSTLLSRLFDKGIYDIVTTTDEADLEKCLLVGKTKEEASVYSIVKPDLTANAVKKENTDTSENAVTVAVATEKSVEKEKIKANKSYKNSGQGNKKKFITVAVCSTEPHMGATHQSLLIAKFLNSIGFKACYLEATKKQSIMYLASAYTVNANEKKKLLQLEGVDMYFDFKLSEIISVGYDFYVFDFGCLKDAPTTSFLTKDIKIFVGGAKAWEIPSYKTVFDCLGDTEISELNVWFILNFAPKREMPDIKELMGKYKDNTYFSDYAPYPFQSGINHHIYKVVFNEYIILETSEKTEIPESTVTGQKPKRKFFKGW